MYACCDLVLLLLFGNTQIVRCVTSASNWFLVPDTGIKCVVATYRNLSLQFEVSHFLHYIATFNYYYVKGSLSWCSCLFSYNLQVDIFIKYSAYKNLYKQFNWSLAFENVHNSISFIDSQHNQRTSTVHLIRLILWLCSCYQVARENA